MRNTAKISGIVMTAALVALGGLSAGCSGMMPTSQPAQATAPPTPPPTAQAPYLPQATVKAAPGDTGLDSPVDSAIMWAEKYAKAVESLSAAQDKLRQLGDDKLQAQKDLDKTKLELAQTQKELADANAMLMEMKGELQNWKKDVLGNRQEMMQAHTAELEALRKIMKVLGSELNDAAPVASGTGDATAAPASASAAPAPATQPSDARISQLEKKDGQTSH